MRSRAVGSQGGGSLAGRAQRVRALRQRRSNTVDGDAEVARARRGDSGGRARRGRRRRPRARHPCQQCLVLVLERTQRLVRCDERLLHLPHPLLVGAQQVERLRQLSAQAPDLVGESGRPGLRLLARLLLALELTGAAVVELAQLQHLLEHGRNLPLVLLVQVGHRAHRAAAAQQAALRRRGGGSGPTGVRRRQRRRCRRCRRHRHLHADVAALAALAAARLLLPRPGIVPGGRRRALARRN